MAEWPSGLGKGLQSPVHGFDSRLRLAYIWPSGCPFPLARFPFQGQRPGVPSLLCERDAGLTGAVRPRTDASLSGVPPPARYRPQQRPGPRRDASLTRENRRLTSGGVPGRGSGLVHGDYGVVG